MRVRAVGELAAQQPVGDPRCDEEVDSGARRQERQIAALLGSSTRGCHRRSHHGVSTGSGSNSMPPWSPGPGTGWPIQGLIRHFRPEIEKRIDDTRRTRIRNPCRWRRSRRTMGTPVPIGADLPLPACGERVRPSARTSGAKRSWARGRSRRRRWPCRSASFSPPPPHPRLLRRLAAFGSPLPRKRGEARFAVFESFRDRGTGSERFTPLREKLNAWPS